MVWTAPRDWATAELVTASIMNTHVRDQLNALSQARAFVVGIGDVNGAVINTGVKGDLEIPFACTITGWTLLGDVSGSIVIDVWKDSYTNFPPTVADSIAGSEKPTLTSQQKNQDLALATWTPNLSAGDILRFNVESAATLKQVSLILRAALA